MSLFGKKLLLKELTKGVHKKEHLPRYLDIASSQMKYMGYRRSFLSAFRKCGLLDISGTFGEIGKNNIPTLILRGSEDTYVPRSSMDKLRYLIPHAEFQEVAGAGHSPHFEKPSEVNSIILEFLHQ